MKRYMWPPFTAVNGRAQRENRLGQYILLCITQLNGTAKIVQRHNYGVYRTIGTMSRDCHKFIVLSPVWAA